MRDSEAQESGGERVTWGGPIERVEGGEGGLGRTQRACGELRGLSHVRDRQHASVSHACDGSNVEDSDQRHVPRACRLGRVGACRLGCSVGFNV